MPKKRRLDSWPIFHFVIEMNFNCRQSIRSRRETNASIHMYTRRYPRITIWISDGTGVCSVFTRVTYSTHDNMMNCVFVRFSWPRAKCYMRVCALVNRPIHFHSFSTCLRLHLFTIPSHPIHVIPILMFSSFIMHAVRMYRLCVWVSFGNVIRE